MPRINCAFCKKPFLPQRSDITLCSMECRRGRSGNIKINKNEWNSWRAIDMRCHYPRYRAYDRYGGRGIKMCERWRGVAGFPNFLEDMGKKPTQKHSIERIDRDGDYTPENCKWADQFEQMNNTSRNKFITIDGFTKTYAQWCQIYKIKYGTFYSRWERGMTLEEALKTPVKKR